MNLFVRHIHKISQNPQQDTEYVEYGGQWTMAAVWRALRCGGNKSRTVESRVTDDGFVFFFDSKSTFHSMIVGPVGGLLALKFDGERP